MIEVKASEPNIKSGWLEFGSFSIGLTGIAILAQPETDIVFHKHEANSASDRVHSLNKQIDAYKTAETVFKGSENIIKTTAIGYLDKAIQDNQTKIIEIKDNAPSYGALQKTEAVGLYAAEVVTIPILVAIGVHKARMALARRKQTT